MPSIGKRNLKQYAVLWPFSAFDAYGQPQVDDPIEIRVRWVTKRTVGVDEQGNNIALDGTAKVDRQIAPHSSMWLGRLTDWQDSGSAGNNSEVMQVRTYSEATELHGHSNRTVRVVGLAKYGDSLPERV